MAKMHRISEALELAVIIERRRKVVNTMGKLMPCANGSAVQHVLRLPHHRVVVASGEC